MQIETVPVVDHVQVKPSRIRRMPNFLFSNRILRAIGEYIRWRRDCQYLESLPDYLLEDIGLTRGDLKVGARK